MPVLNELILVILLLTKKADHSTSVLRQDAYPACKIVIGTIPTIKGNGSYMYYTLRRICLFTQSSNVVTILRFISSVSVVLTSYLYSRVILIAYPVIFCYVY